MFAIKFVTVRFSWWKMANVRETSRMTLTSLGPMPM